MLENYALGLVERYVEPYADVDREQLRVAVREGKVTLSDVKLKPAAFDSLGFPLTVRSGRVGEVQVDVTWSALTARPAKVHLRDVTVVIGPSGSEASAETRKDRLAMLQAESLRSDEEARVLRLRGAAPASVEEQSFGMRTVAAALGALEVEISNVHMRYEDESSDPTSPFSFGVKLDRLALVTVDGLWRATPAAQATLAAIAHKILKVEGLAMYWQHSSDAGSLDFGRSCSSSPYHVLCPLHMEVKMSLNRMGVPSQGAPRITGNITVLGQARINIDCATMRQVSCIVDSAIAHENRMRQTQPRPCAGYKKAPRAWWAYACACVLDEARRRRGTRQVAAVVDLARIGKMYVALFKELLHQAADPLCDKALCQDDRNRLEDMESRMPAEMIMALRARCEELVEEALVVARRSLGNGLSLNGTLQSHAPRGWLFSRLFRGWRTSKASEEEVAMDVAGVELVVSENELRDLCFAKKGSVSAAAAAAVCCEREGEAGRHAPVECCSALSLRAEWPRPCRLIRSFRMCAAWPAAAVVGACLSRD